MMLWYEVEIELNIFGKANEYVQADSKETAEKIADSSCQNDDHSGGICCVSGHVHLPAQRSSVARGGVRTY